MKNYLRRSVVFALLAYGLVAQSQPLVKEASTRKLLFSFKDETEASVSLPENSSYWRSLDGDWRFKWSKQSDERPQDFYMPNYDISTWDMIKVPSDWKVYALNKYHKPRYGMPSYRPNNEVGSYVRFFEVPKEWKKREVYLDFTGVAGSFYVWVNGQKVDVAEHSVSVVSFNITKQLKKGNNKLAVEVHSTANDSIAERSGVLQLPGIFRSVALRATPELQLNDLQIMTDSQDFVNWELQLRAQVRNLRKKAAQNYKIQYKLRENILYSDVLRRHLEPVEQEVPLEIIGGKTSVWNETTMKVKKPMVWTDETPYRYTLIAQLIDRKGRVAETVSTPITFRKIEVRKNKEIYVNGEPIELKGVKRQEGHPAQGRTLTHEQMEDEIMLMKRANVNYVYSIPYPPDPYWFYLCDKYGIFLAREINFEDALLPKKHWVDQTIYLYTDKGTRYEGYGEDFGKGIEEKAAMTDGVIFASRIPKPQFYQLQKDYQNIEVKKLSNDTFQLINKAYFEPMDGYEGVWTLYRDGQKVEERSFDVSPLKPQLKGTVRLTPKRMDSGAEYYATIEFKQAADRPWCEKGFVQAREQFLLQKGTNKPKQRILNQGDALQLTVDKKIVVGKNFTVHFDYERGTIESLTYNNSKVIEDNGLNLNVLSDEKWHHRVIDYKIFENEDGSYSYCFMLESIEDKALATTTESETVSPLVTYQEFIVFTDGTIEVLTNITGNDEQITVPQLGYEIKMPTVFYNFKYYGRGRQENTEADKEAAFMGVYEGDVRSEFVPYAQPQTMGQHQDTQWASITNMRGTGAEFVAMQPMSVSALPYGEAQLKAAAHPYQLPEPDGTYIRLDAITAEKPTSYWFGFLIRPVSR